MVAGLVVALALGLLRLWPRLAATPWSLEPLVFLAAAGAVVAFGGWTVLTSETSIDGEAIRQETWWSKKVALADLTQVKLVRVPGWDAIVVPRLLVRTKGLGVTTFTAGDAQLVEAFHELAVGRGQPEAGVTPTSGPRDRER